MSREAAAEMMRPAREADGGGIKAEPAADFKPIID